MRCARAAASGTAPRFLALRRRRYRATAWPMPLRPRLPGWRPGPAWDGPLAVGLQTKAGPHLTELVGLLEHSDLGPYPPKRHSRRQAADSAADDYDPQHRHRAPFSVVLPASRRYCAAASPLTLIAGFRLAGPLPRGWGLAGAKPHGLLQPAPTRHYGQPLAGLGVNVDDICFRLGEP